MGTVTIPHSHVSFNHFLSAWAFTAQVIFQMLISGMVDNSDAWNAEGDGFQCLSVRSLLIFFGPEALDRDGKTVARCARQSLPSAQPAANGLADWTYRTDLLPVRHTR